MAIAYDFASRSFANSTTTSHSHTFTGSERFSLFGVYQGIDHTNTAIACGAQTPTLIATIGRLALYQQIAPAAGSQTCSVTSDQTGGLILGVVSYTGVDQATPVGTFQTGTSTEVTSVTTDAITSAVGQLVVDVCALIIDTGMTPGGGQTARLNIDEATHGVGFFSFGMSEKAGASSVTMTWSAASTVGDNLIIGVPLIAAAALASPVLGRRYFVMP